MSKTLITLLLASGAFLPKTVEEPQQYNNKPVMVEIPVQEKKVCYYGQTGDSSLSCPPLVYCGKHLFSYDKKYCPK